ncbi:MAG: hypothetical protein HYX27_23080 [Acidobacteria bacterium]|nr:hypothetical protein [Acidobacteriota bacterium]
MQSLFEATFQTARPPNPLYCHTDFLERLEQYRNQPIGKRAALLLQRLLIDPERLHFKSTQGVNRGWRRSRLGGSSGSHFYAWWAPAGALPLKDVADTPAGALFLRAIRHHDDHTPLEAQAFPADYLPVSVPEVRHEEYGPSPWTQQQLKFATARDAVRVLKGHPGSGKTTALLHAADNAGGQNVLYLTYSADLASLARSYFDRYCSSGRQYHVHTFPQFIRAMLGVEMPPVPLAEQRRGFRAEVVSLSRMLGPWASNIPALFDEFHAHIVGAALPVRIGRFAAARLQRMNDRDYIASRTRYTGSQAAEAANNAATRLEKSSGAIAPRLFPDLHLAWTAVQQLPNVPASALPWDCIAIDECQDLTPIETLFVARLAKRLRELRGHTVPVLIAGDEAQTVRPTDFEWGWLNDIFHAELATPTIHKLSSNLRSPRQIAELINRVWDLYAHLEKQDRPSGQGWASIEDDATDQILYCSAAPGEALTALLNELSSREGLAIVSFAANGDAIPNALTPSEIKGLDFHSVCVVNAGEQLEHVQTSRFMPADIERLSRRLAIDQLRVAISRPTERLIWLDIGAKPSRVAACLEFLNGRMATPLHAALSPDALLRSLQEENLDIEERVQRCQDDARQYISVRPDLAWSRAHQAVALLGKEDDLGAVADPLTRRTANMTLAEVCFTLAMNKARLSPELGEPSLLFEAARAAAQAGQNELVKLFGIMRDLRGFGDSNEINAAVALMSEIPGAIDSLPAWFRTGIEAESLRWISLLERVQHVESNGAICARVLPPFYKALGLPDAEERTARLRTRAIGDLVKARYFREALAILVDLPERNHRLEAQCHEGTSNFAAAAESHRASGNLDDAIDCYRRVPDIQRTLSVMSGLNKPHTAAPALEWIAAMQSLAGQRPDNFNKVVKAEEKKLLEAVLETALGVQRRKPAAKKAATKKAAAKKTAVRKTIVRKRPPPMK